MYDLPKITIITANFNQGKFLETTIRSVVEQKYSNIEYIIIDGKSTDNSVEIIKRYEKQISYWISEPDKGQTDAINKGLKIASGEIITWLNADDYFMPGTLQKAADLYRAQKYDFLLGNSIFVDENGNIMSEQFKSSLINNCYFIPCDKRCRVHQPSSFFSKGILEKTGLLDPLLHYAMDVDFWMKIMAYNGKMIYKDIDFTYFRRHGEAKSAKGNLPFVQETIKSNFFNIQLKAITPIYYRQCKRSIYRSYIDNLYLEHESKRLFSFSCIYFFLKPGYTIKIICSYLLLKLKLKFAKN